MGDEKLSDGHIQSMVFLMVKEMQKISLAATSTGLVKIDPTTVADKATITDSEMEVQMKTYAIHTAKRAFASVNDRFEVAKFICNEFQTKYGGDWHCLVGRFSYNIVPAPMMYIEFYLTEKEVVLNN